MNKPSQSPLGGLQQLELFSLFAKHFHIQIAMGLDPAFVDFDCQCLTKRRALSWLGKMRITWVRRLSSSLMRSSILATLEMLVVPRGAACKR